MKSVARLCAALFAVFFAPAANAADVPPSYAPPPVVVDTYQAPACYAMFHTLPDAEGAAALREGPEAVPVIKDLRFDNGLRMRGRISSVTTSPGARIELFQGRHYRKLVHDVGPASIVNITRPRVRSYRLHCPEPPPPPVPPSFK